MNDMGGDMLYTVWAETTELSKYGRRIRRRERTMILM